MRNRVSFLKQYPRESAVSSATRVLVAAAALLVLTSSWPCRGSLWAAQDVQPPGTPAPSLARLFTPRHAPDGAYTVTVLTEGVDAALANVKRALAPDVVAVDPPGSWQVQSLDPLEAFGSAGTYDRSKVARLYAGRRVSVVRGPVERNGRVVAAVTLISPYPDATLSKLESGTLAIVLRIAGSW
jgi:hypothetical protein